MRMLALLTAVAFSATPLRPLAAEPVQLPRPANPAPSADLAVRPEPEDPLVRALKDDPELARRAGSGRTMRNAGVGMVILGILAVPVAVVVGRSDSGSGIGETADSAMTGLLVLTAGAMSIVGGGFVWAAGNARRSDAAARWNASHPDRPVHP